MKKSECVALKLNEKVAVGVNGRATELGKLIARATCILAQRSK
jgi:hypothetical protein